MCTVSYIPHAKGVFIASNRDEQVSRSLAAMPATYEINGVNIIFPKDGKAGGTWVAAREDAGVMVLMNGAFQPHVMGGTYRMSRGLIFLDCFSHINPAIGFKEIDLRNIEPFTVMLWHAGALWDMRWDGGEKWIKQMDASKPHIWSSAQLYSKETIRNREEWFEKWLANKDNNQLQINDIKHFHTFGGQAESNDDALVMYRGDILRTISITTIEINGNSLQMDYDDLITSNKSSLQTRIK